MLPIPAEFRTVVGLGSPKQLYPVRKSSKWGNIIGAVLLLVGGGAVLLWGLVDTYTRWQANGPAVIVKTITAPLVIFGFALVFGIILAYSAFANWKKAVVLYDNGFALQDHKGIHTARWDEVASMTSAVTRHYTNGIYSGTTHVYTILKKDSSKVIINDSIQKVEEVATQIRTGAYPLLYQLYAQAYNTGKPLSFGPVVVSKANGLQIGKKSYPWDQVAKVSIQKGFVQVAKKGGGWFSGASAAASAIPNLEVMLSIIDQVVGVATK